MNITEDIIIHNKNCFDVFPKIEDKSINLFILDLPFGCTACKWDSVIDLEQMWKHIKRIMKPNALIVFFCTAKFGYTLIHSNPKWFKYDLIWKKSRKVGFLSANKMPLRQHENIYVFNGNNDENEDLMNYSKKVLKHIGKTKSAIKKEIPMADHFFRYSKANFSLPTKETYEKLIELYNINFMEDFIPFEELEGTYNPQKTEGTPYKTNEAELTNSYYRGGAKEYKTLGTENKGDRHPTSIINEIPEYEGDTILVYKNPHKTIHRTQKPVELLEWLIKTYSNEGDTVMDFTMGSGTCGIACMNTKRKFIGVEMDAEIFDAAQNRFEDHKKKSVIVI